MSSCSSEDMHRIADGPRLAFAPYTLSSWSAKLFALPSPGGFPAGVGLAGPALAPDRPAVAAAATEGVYHSPTVASDEQLRSSWSWNGLCRARHTVCA